jgi:RNA polymerase sigma-70 factor (ECF subfamily)
MPVPDSQQAVATGLEAVFLDNRNQLLRFLRARGGGDASEDLLQELWIRVSTAPPGPVADPLPYLYRAANNLMVDRYRTEARAARRNQEWTDHAGPTAAGISDEPSGERVLMGRERLREAQDTLAGLGERVATVFRRFRIEGESQRDIAQDLGLSLSAVEKDLQKAYRALLALRRRNDAE